MKSIVHSPQWPCHWRTPMAEPSPRLLRLGDVIDGVLADLGSAQSEWAWRSEDVVAMVVQRLRTAGSIDIDGAVFARTDVEPRDDVAS
jgi:hypothetical protein